jgi:hypothetical protein
VNKIKALLLASALATGIGACAYSGVTTLPDGRVVVPRNDSILFGLLRAVYVCNVTPAGLANCVAGQAP